MWPPSSVFLSSSPVRIILQNSLPSSSSSEDDRRQDASTEDDQPISKVGRKRELREMRKHRFDLHPRKPNGTPRSCAKYVNVVDLTKRIDKRTTEDSASFAFIVSSSPIEDSPAKERPRALRGARIVPARVAIRNFNHESQNKSIIAERTCVDFASRTGEAILWK